MRRLFLIVGLLVACSLSVSAQVDFEVVNFNSGDVNMFDPDTVPVPYSINESFSLPSDGPFTWDKVITIGDSWSTGSLDLGPFGTFGGFSFSASFTAGTWGSLGMAWEVKDFTEGTVQVNYPANITTLYSTPNSYSSGEWVYLESSYVRGATAAITTEYPDSGVVNLDLYSDVNVELSATVGISGLGIGGTYTYAPVDFHTGDYTGGAGTATTNFMHLSEDTSYYFGYANTASQPAPGYPNASTTAYLECTYLSQAQGNCDPAQVYKTDPALPIATPNVYGNPIPLSLSATLPYVNTTSSPLGAYGLQASGDSSYIDLTFPVLQTILSELTGIPGEVFAASISEDIGGTVNLEISWVLAAIDAHALLTNHQEFDFQPEVHGKYHLPTPVQYEVYRNGTLISSGIDTLIQYIVGDSVRFKHPCFYDNLRIDRSFSLIGDFHSNTYNTVDFQLVMEAAGLKVNIPGFNIIPAYSWNVCIPYGYPCGGPFWPSWCSGCVNTGFSTPAIDFPAISFSTCDLYASQGLVAGTAYGNYNASNCAFNYFNQTWPIIPYTWHENTWSMPFTQGGSVDHIASSITLSGRPIVATSSATAIPCKGGNGTISVSITNGVGPYNVVWSNGSVQTIAQTGNVTTFSSPSFVAGNYIATITDSNGCQTVTGTILNEPLLPLSISGITTDVDCFNASTGEIDITVSGGTPTGGGTYSYAWSTVGGSGLTPTDADQTGLTDGTYTVIVTDANSCDTTASFVIDEPDNIVITTTIEDVDCFGNATGALTASVLGGTQPYTYAWDEFPASGVLSTLPSLNDVSAGNYQLSITDVNGCALTETYTVNEPPALTISTVLTNEDCFGQNIGEVDVTVGGGSPFGGANPYTYLWYNGLGQLMSNTSEDATGLYADTYTVIVTDANNCTISSTDVITEPTELVISSFALQDIGCFGGATGAIDIEVQGGTGAYVYDWDNDGVGDNDDAQDLTSLVAGTYAVVVYDANGCSTAGTYTLNEPAQPLSASTSVVDVDCFGTSTGSIDLTVLGGTMPYAYDWDNDGVGDNDDSEDLTSVAANNYTVIVTDANNCTFSVSGLVNEPADLLLSETHANVLCYGGNSGSIDLSVVGGVAPYAYQWSNSGSILLTPTSQDLTNLYSDTYLVTVTDNNMCQETLTVTIDQPSAPIALSAVGTDVDCNGNSTGSIDLTVTGGTGAYGYSWSGPGGFTAATEDISALVAGVYTATVTDINGCQDFIDVTITEPAQPIVASVVPTAVNCFGESTGEMNLTVSGGTGPYTYDWDNDGVGDNDDEEDLEYLLSGTYVVIITDANGCNQSAGGFVSQPNQALTITAIVTEPSCFEYEDGSIELVITGGTAPYYVEWGDSSQFLLNNPSELLSGLADADYLFRVLDDKGCVVEQNVVVGQPDTLDVNVVITDVSCYQGADGSIELTANGGTPPYTYDWSNNSALEDQYNLTMGNYSYELTDAQGCVYEQTMFVDQAPEINIYSEVVPLSCIDQDDAGIIVQTAGGTQPYTWLWSNGNTNENIDNLVAGSYQLVITDDFGCQRIYDFSVSSTDAECVQPVNTFTPNGDNYNDTWVIDNLDLYPNAELRVFNRWGTLLYKSIGEYTPWDGTYNGKPLPSEVYYYIIVLNNGVDNEYTGTITIVR